MPLGTAENEIKKSDELWDSTGIKALREQQETDFGHWGPHTFNMPSEEGKWDDQTTNSPKVIANKIMGLLASSWLQLYIDVEEEDEKERKQLTNTERLANGSIWAADRRATVVPSGKKLLGSLSTFAVIKGGTAKSVYWYTDDEKQPVCDIKSYDPMYCQWEEGEGELLWFCHRNYVPKAWLERRYKDKKNFNYGETDGRKRVLTYTFWDDNEWKLAVNGEYFDSGEHKLGYIPVNIRSCGAVPYIQSEKYQDTMKWSWVSVFANTRSLYDLESKLLSIEASKAIESGRIKIAGEWNSQDSDNVLPEGLEKLGYGAKTRNEIILFDSAKGQKFGGMIQPPDNQVIDQFLTRVRGMDILGSIDPIAFGQMTRSGSGALAAELRAAALEFINPFRECVQDDLIWIAEESVRQFKNGQYTKTEVEGRDSRRFKFRESLEPSDVTDTMHFDCELVPDRLRDELQELGAAIQKVSYGLTSRRTARLQHNIVADPDREQDIMDEEEAARDPVHNFRKQAKYWLDKGDEEMAAYYKALSTLAVQRTIQEALKAELLPEEETKPPVISPQTNTSRIATEPQQF